MYRFFLDKNKTLDVGPFYTRMKTAYTGPVNTRIKIRLGLQSSQKVYMAPVKLISKNRCRFGLKKNCKLLEVRFIQE